MANERVYIISHANPIALEESVNEYIKSRPKSTLISVSHSTCCLGNSSTVIYTIVLYYLEDRKLSKTPKELNDEKEKR
jgi:hypothetical protein